MAVAAAAMTTTMMMTTVMMMIIIQQQHNNKVLYVTYLQLQAIKELAALGESYPMTS
jgi:phosphoribosyl-AMP cyclohydrolase